MLASRDPRDDLLDAQSSGGGPGRTPHGNYVLSECQMEVSSSAEFTDAKPVEFASAKADLKARTDVLPYICPLPADLKPPIQMAKTSD